MKNIYNNFFKKLTFCAAIGGALVLTSCNEDESYDTGGTIKPVVSVASATYSVDEGSDVTITLNSDVMFKEDMHLQLEIVDENGAILDEDYTVNLDHTNLDWGDSNEQGYKITFPAFSNSYTFTLSALADDVIDEGETVTFRFKSNGNFYANTDESANQFTVTINHKASNFVDFTFSWDQTFDLGGTPSTLCGIEYDNDFIYTDDSFSPIDYLAATANCPEQGQIDVAELGDGTFHIFQNVWDDGGLSALGIPTFSIPVTVEYGRVASSTLNGTYVQDAANAVNSDFGSDPGLNAPAYVISFTINNGVVTLFDLTTTQTIATGKTKALKPVMKDLYKLASLKRNK